MQNHDGAALPLPILLPQDMHPTHKSPETTVLNSNKKN